VIILKKLLTFFIFMPLVSNSVAIAMKSTDNNDKTKKDTILELVKNLNIKIEHITLSADGEFFLARENGSELRTLLKNPQDAFFFRTRAFPIPETIKLFVMNINNPKLLETFDINPFSNGHYFSSTGKFLVIEAPLHTWNIYSLHHEKSQYKTWQHDWNFFVIAEKGSLFENMVSDLSKDMVPDLFKIKIFSNSRCPQFSPDEKFLGVIDCNFTCKIFDTSSYPFKEVQTINNTFDIQFSPILPSQRRIVGINDSNDCLTIFSLHTDGSLKKEHLFNGISTFKFISDGNILKIKPRNSDMDEYWDTYTWEKKTSFSRILFDKKNYKSTMQQNNIKNFFSGENPKDIKYSDINIFFQ